MLFVDQLEELYTLGASVEARRDFIDAMCCAADDPAGPVRVVFTVREDFLGRLAETEASRQALSRVTVLRSPGPAALEQVLVRPVRARGHEFESPELVTRMIDEVRGEPAALPLLQVAAEQMWERRDRDGRRLTSASYEQIGGVAGALARGADEAFDAMTPEQAEMGRALLMRLVTPERTRRVLPRAEVLEGLGEHATDALDRLVAARTLSVRKGRSGEPAEVELVHESLIDRWQRLVRWLDDSREEAAFLAEVGQAAKLWDKRGRHAEELWRGRALDEALARLERVASPPQRVVDYLRQAEHSERRRRRTRRISYAALVVVLAALAAVLAWRERVASARKEEAEQAQLREREGRAQALRESAKASLAAGELFQSRAQLRAALELADSVTARAMWSELAERPLRWSLDLGTTLWGLAMWPDGTRVATGGTDGVVFVVDTRTTQVRTLRGHAAAVRAVAISPEGRLASASVDGVIRLWDPATWEPHVVDTRTAELRAVGFGPRGQRLFWTSGAPHVGTWNASTGAIRSFGACERRCAGLAIDPRGRYLVTGSGSHILVFDIETEKLVSTLTKGKRGVEELAFSPDGQWLVSQHDGGKTRLWSVGAWQSVAERDGYGSTYCLPAFDHQSKRVAIGRSSSSVVLWSVEQDTAWEGMFAHSDKRLTSQVMGVAWSPDGAFLALSRGYAHTLEMVRVPSRPGRGAKRVALERAYRGALDFSPDGAHLAVGQAQGQIYVYDVQTARPVRELQTHGNLRSIRYDPRARWLAALSDRLTVWDGHSYEPLYFQSSAVGSGLAVSPDGRLLVGVGRGGQALVWDPLTGTTFARLALDQRSHSGVNFNRDGSQLATASNSGSIRIFDTRTWSETATLQAAPEALSGVAFLRDGAALATSSRDGPVRIWDVAAGTSRVIGPPTRSHMGLQVHPDGTRLAVTSFMGSPPRLIDADTGEHIDLLGHLPGEDVNDICFSPDGTLVATASDDATVRVWRADTGQPYWRTPLLLATTPRLLSHRGWERLDRADEPPSPPTARWAKAIAERARTASPSSDDTTLCAMTHDDELQLWRSADGELAVEQTVPGFQQVVAFGGGCLALANGKASWYRPGQAPATWADSAVALGYADDRALVATAKLAQSFGPDGGVQQTWAINAGTTALTLVDGQLVVGRSDGTLELVGPTPERSRQLPRAASAAVLTLRAGPAETLLVGQRDGTVALLSLASGALLRSWRLHGAATHLRVHDSTLYAVSELGDTLSQDLSIFSRPYCQLMREVWDEVPVVWEEERAKLSPPPPEHKCASR